MRAVGSGFCNFNVLRKRKQSVYSCGPDLGGAHADASEVNSNQGTAERTAVSRAGKENGASRERAARLQRWQTCAP
eukprot:6200806-Pleurochrysis_carterae.AAC.1